MLLNNDSKSPEVILNTPEVTPKISNRPEALEFYKNCSLLHFSMVSYFITVELKVILGQKF